MEKYTRQEPRRSYSTAGFGPYGVADVFIMDCYVDDGFSGNVLIELLKNGFQIAYRNDCFVLVNSDNKVIANLSDR